MRTITLSWGMAAPTPSRASLQRGRKPRVRVYEFLEEEVAALRERYGGLPSPIEARDIWGDIWQQEAHNSTAIEGNTLVLREVELLLREGKAVGDKPLKDYLEVEGYARAAEWIYDQARGPGDWTTGKLLTMAEVRHVHETAMTPVWQVAPHADATPQEGPGSFRRHNIAPFPGGMQPPDWTAVPMLTDDWVANVCRLDDDPLPFLEALARLHNELERIHPFLDGNGRTGRLLTNLILIRKGYPPAIIRRVERDRYLRALRKADDGDPGPLGEFLARAVLATLNRFIVPAVAGPYRLVPLISLADGTMTAPALRGAAERGRLKAHQDEAGRWLSSRAWVEEYKRSRSPRGRPPASVEPRRRGT
jgi:Fic/DOC family